jgi:NADH-quinone oxidoreductase subunit L
VISLAWLVPAFPLLGAIIAAAAGRWLKQQAHWPVIVGIALSFVVTMMLTPHVGPSAVGHHAETTAKAPTVVVYRWLQIGGFTDDAGNRTYQLDVPIEFRVDGLTVMMLGMVTFVSALVAVFAVGYMAGDPGYPRFFAEIGLFVFSMTGLVLSNNYVLTYAFWEGVGVCSYLLIGFWYTRRSAAAAAQKAFLVNRVGDVGFAIAIFWMWTTVFHHDLSYDNVLSEANLHAMTPASKLAIALLLFWAATAKSAQVPLYVWLPDAMEGPTPVSALIHAATMVTAGVYLIARSAVLVFDQAAVPLVVCSIGCITALLAALMALTQHDLKRVLAYSTISQLGFMFMALGCGVGDVMLLAVVAAMFHLFTHAFFKALLFLGSGSVMHAMGHVIDMRRFRGLRHRMPITCWTFAIGGLSLAGIVPLAGFWSKDEILAALNLAAAQGESVPGGWAVLYRVIYALALTTAFLTAFYTGRAFFLTFFGPEKLPSPDDPEAEPDEHLPAHEPGHADEPELEHAQEHAHDHGSHFGQESPPVMTVPLIVLAACTVLVGIAFGPTGWFANWVERTPSWALLRSGEHHADWLSIGLGTLVGMAGIALAWWMYAKPSPVPGRLARRLGGLYRASYEKFRVDEMYDAVIVRPLRGLALVCRFLDVYVVDRLVQLVAWIPRLVGRDLLAPFQNGLVQFYAAAGALGVAAVLVYLLLT